jgi:hypothetical protein
MGQRQNRRNCGRFSPALTLDEPCVSYDPADLGAEPGSGVAPQVAQRGFVARSDSTQQVRDDSLIFGSQRAPS